MILQFSCSECELSCTFTALYSEQLDGSPASTESSSLSFPCRNNEAAPEWEIVNNLCDTCKGDGWVTYKNPENNYETTLSEKCSDCNGSGRKELGGE